MTVQQEPTILYPFVLPDAISSEVIDLAAAAIASVPAFEGTFAGWLRSFHSARDEA